MRKPCHGAESREVKSLHFLQHLAARIASLPISLLHVDAYTQSDCPPCAPFFQSSPDLSALDPPLVPLSSAKYLLLLSSWCQLPLLSRLLRL